MTKQFRYVAKKPSGQNISGIIEAEDKNKAVELLHKNELTIITLKEEKRLGKVRKGKVSLDDLAIFSRQLATMVDSGIALVHCLEILGEQSESKTLVDVSLKIQSDIESGKNFYDCLAQHPYVFSELYISMVKAGEVSGKLNEILERLAEYLEKTSALQRKIRSSLIYPAVVISMALIITSILLLKVVPTFKGIFESLGGTLPLPTQILLAISDIFRRYFIFVFLSFIVFIFLLKKYISTPKGRYKFDRLLLNLPIFGILVKKVAVAKFTRTLATLVRSGVPIINALTIVGKTSGNKIVEEAVVNAAMSVKEGEPISGPLLRSKVFPPMVVRMISVGEQTGELEKMLNKIADFYDSQVDAAVSGLTSMIEPIVIGFLGIIIGGIVVALFLPIFKITELLGK